MLLPVPADATAPPTLADLKSYLLAHGLAVQKTPKRLELITEVPTATGKIQKHVLRQDIARKISEPAAAP